MMMRIGDTECEGGMRGKDKGTVSKGDSECEGGMRKTSGKWMNVMV